MALVSRTGVRQRTPDRALALSHQFPHRSFHAVRNENGNGGTLRRHCQRGHEDKSDRGRQ